MRGVVFFSLRLSLVARAHSNGRHKLIYARTHAHTFTTSLSLCHSRSLAHSSRSLSTALVLHSLAASLRAVCRPMRFSVRSPPVCVSKINTLAQLSKQFLCPPSRLVQSLRRRFCRRPPPSGPATVSFRARVMCKMRTIPTARHANAGQQNGVCCCTVGDATPGEMCNNVCMNYGQSTPSARRVFVWVGALARGL